MYGKVFHRHLKEYFLFAGSDCLIAILLFYLIPNPLIYFCLSICFVHYREMTFNSPTRGMDFLVSSCVFSFMRFVLNISRTIQPLKHFNTVQPLGSNNLRAVFCLLYSLSSSCIPFNLFLTLESDFLFSLSFFFSFVSHSVQLNFLYLFPEFVFFFYIVSRIGIPQSIPWVFLPLIFLVPHVLSASLSMTLFWITYRATPSFI